jgi:hypothetical protein
VKNRPLGRYHPWAYFVEIVRGCNLKCWHCPTRLFPRREIHYMEIEVWKSLMEVINIVSPYVRVELCNAGEPTLHPRILEFLRIGRKMAPHVQFLTYTNGTMLTNGKLTYKKLFEAGLNNIFVDMYTSFEVHKKLAEESGFFWFYQDVKVKSKDCPNIFAYKDDPDSHIIMLAENPSNWSRRKRARGYFTTYLNDLDWEEALKHGVGPIVSAPKRRCDIPFKFISINYDGTFPFCCFDYMRHTAGKLGNIKGGVEEFKNFWLGRYMQELRIKLLRKERSGHEFCKICNFTSIRCDIPWWTEEMVKKYYRNGKWLDLPSKLFIPSVVEEIPKKITPFFKNL